MEGGSAPDSSTLCSGSGAAKVATITGTIVTKDEISFNRVVGDFGTEPLVARRLEPAK